MKKITVVALVFCCLLNFQSCSDKATSAEPQQFDYSLMGDTLRLFNTITLSFAGKHLYDTSVAGHLDENLMTWTSDSGMWSESQNKIFYSDRDGWSIHNGSTGYQSRGSISTQFTIDPRKRIIEHLQDSSDSYSWNNIPMEVVLWRGIEARSIPLISINEDSAVFISQGTDVENRILRATQFFRTYYRYYWNSRTSLYQGTDWAGIPEPELRIVLSRH